MKAVTWQGKRDVQVKEMPDPKIEEPTDVVIKVTSTVGKSVKVKVGRRFVTRGLWETTSCPTGGRKVNVKYTDTSGATFNAFKVAPCQR